MTPLRRLPRAQQFAHMALVLRLAMALLLSHVRIMLRSLCPGRCEGLRMCMWCRRRRVQCCKVIDVVDGGARNRKLLAAAVAVQG